MSSYFVRTSVQALPMLHTLMYSSQLIVVLEWLVVRSFEIIINWQMTIQHMTNCKNGLFAKMQWQACINNFIQFPQFQTPTSVSWWLVSNFTADMLVHDTKTAVPHVQGYIAKYTMVCRVYSYIWKTYTLDLVQHIGPCVFTGMTSSKNMSLEHGKVLLMTTSIERNMAW